MNVVIFNWRDLSNPKSGGAEVVTHHLAEGLALRGHSVTWFTSQHDGAPTDEFREGYSVVRRGSELTCRFHGFRWLRSRPSPPDIVIDEVNTLPFLSVFACRAPVIVWMHQLAREVWFAEAPPVLGQIGYLTESLMLSIYKRRPVVTISESSRQSLREIGLEGAIQVAEVPLEPPRPNGDPVMGRVGYVGRLAPSKRVDHIIRAIAFVKETHPCVELYIVGGGSRAELDRLQNLTNALGLEKAVKFIGRVSREERDKIVASLDILAMASLREGWGLVVSEAARFGVPSVVYPVHGLVDSVMHEETGLVAEAACPQYLADGIVRILQDRALRNRYGKAASENLYRFTMERFLNQWERTILEVASGRKRRKRPAV